MSALDVVPRGPSASGPRLDVDLGAVAHNVRLLAERVRGDDTLLMAVVKANGFGLGAVDVARTALAHGARGLGVTSIDEALRLREAGLRAPVLSWLNPVDADWDEAVTAGVDVAISSREHLEAFVRSVPRTGSPARVHLHLDCGMARDGAEPQEWVALCVAARAAQREGVLHVVGVMGHLGCADDPSDPANAIGRTRFSWGVRIARRMGLRPSLRHLAATSAVLTDPRTHHTAVRVGAGVVGIDPSRTTRLRGCVTVSAPLVSVRRVRAGTPVGYGDTWRTPRATTLGLLPLGYADGLPRSASGRAEALWRGSRVDVVGRISMDQVVVDLGERHASLGEVVTLIGPGDHGEPDLAEWATWSDTLEHEILTGLGSRLRRTTTPAPAACTEPATLRSVR